MSASVFAPWKRMIAASAAVALALFVYKVTRDFPGEQYAQLLADFRFGFTKRALIGALAGLFFSKLPVWSPYALGGAMVIAAAALYVAAFRRAFGGGADGLPLFVFTAASPLFLKNFVQTLGYYDIYGCCLALILLLAPARSRLYVVGAALGCAVLILIHHLHMLLYVPTIVAIVAIRYYLPRPFLMRDAALGVTLLFGVGLVALAAQFAGRIAVPQAEFVAYLASRMTDPAVAARLPTGMFFQTLTDELTFTWYWMPKNLARAPVYAAVILLHWPLIGYARRLFAALAHDRDRRLVAAAVIAVTLGYGAIFALVFDYARWVAGWSSCMILMLCAVRTLPRRAEPAPITPGGKLVLAAGWTVALLPRLGTTMPF